MIGEIHLYFSYPDHISDSGLLRQYKSLLSEDELENMNRFHFARHRHQYLITRALVRTCLSAYYPVEPADWTFSKNNFGKPWISHPDRQLPIRFNLSHTNGLVMCGVVQDYEIGVDVEDIERPTNTAYEDICRYFSTRETADLLELPEQQQKQRFFDYWTLKESYIKALGMGLSIPLDKFSFLFKHDKLTGFSIHPDLKDNADSWQFWRVSLDTKYRVAVAVKGGSNNFKLIAFNSVPLRSGDPIPLNLL